ncbi:MAG: hypothetical protein FJZ89_06415 [Chloroflexi bacterium]|nr:hypothetical protein [Chloroflexota bacterium]
MDRGIPVAGNEEIELYLRTYYSLLRSTGEIQVRSLVETHSAMQSSLHLRAEEPTPDISAFVYAVMRLPPEIFQTRLVLLGQSDEVFDRRGYPNVEQWQLVEAAARHRRCFFDGQQTMAVFIASVSDIDDLVPMLTALQIEWNKLHQAMATPDIRALLEDYAIRAQEPDWRATIRQEEDFCRRLGIEHSDFSKLWQAWGERLWANLLTIAQQEKNLAVRLLAGSFTDYKRATQGWWQTILQKVADVDLPHRPVYFVSSNTHSLVNLLGGYAQAHTDEIVAYIQAANPEDLWAEYQRLESASGTDSRENWLYYALRKWLATPDGGRYLAERQAWHEAIGICHVQTPLYLDLDAQVIEIGRLDPARLDPRLAMPGLERLRQSRAVIFNIDYPLGQTAYNLLSQVTTGVAEIRGAYAMGKAATLNGRIGDVMIPNVVYDEHSQNTFLFRNCFTAQDVASYLRYGTVLDNQKTVTVRGTFLQNRKFVELFYKEGYTDIEMESGPYLSAIYEHLYPRRYPVNEIVNLFLIASYDIGLLHYASDTPYSRRQSLLSKSLSYFGMDATYATAIAILRRILANELAIL